MTDWTMRLKRAKWLEFEFLTDSHDSTHGMRLIVTELPGADEPIVEALGAKADGYKVTAYFIGPDYDLQRNRFLSLLRQDRADWLMHPWLGEVWVRAQNWSVHESTDKGGYCTVVVDFAPGGQAPFAPIPDMVDTAFDCVNKMVDASPFKFLSMSAAAVNKFVTQVQSRLDIVRNSLSMARMPLTMATQVMGAIDSAKSLVAEALAVPGAYASMMGNLANVIGQSANDDLSESGRVRVVSSLSRNASATVNERLDHLVVPSLMTNAAADALMRGTLLASSAMTLALADYTSAVSRDAAQSSVLSAMDVLMPKMSDELFFAAANARAAFIAAMQAQVLETDTINVATALPAVVLAYAHGLSEAALIERNSVRHPLFVKGRLNV